MELPAAVRTLLDAMATGDWAPVKDVVTDDVVYEATVPGWHFSMAGTDDVVTELATWTGEHPWRLHDLRATRTESGVLLEMELRGQCPGHGAEHPPHEEATRNALVVDLAGERISELRLTCAGDWDAETIARIEAEAPRVR
jgi:hypothetical protein